MTSIVSFVLLSSTMKRIFFREALLLHSRVPEWDTWPADPNLICNMEPNLAEDKQEQAKPSTSTTSLPISA